VRFGTGLPGPTARDDFIRARRRQALSALRRRLLGRAASYELLLPFDEVVGALGRRGERDLGERVIEVDSIVGSVDRDDGFARLFRPGPPVEPSPDDGAEPPPIDVYRVGDAHFVFDGHRRVAVARASGAQTIRAHVTEVLTVVGATRDVRLEDLPRKNHERIFAERVPLPPATWSRIELRQPEDFADLAEIVEAWGFRYQQLHGVALDRQENARTWLAEDYEPAVLLLREAGLLTGDGTETEAYLRLARQRYRLLRTGPWDVSVLARLRGEPGKS
jgi:hypothetical protein